MYDNNDVDDGDEVDNDDVGDDDDDDDDGGGGGGGGDDTYKIGSHRPPGITSLRNPVYIPDVTNAYPCFLPLCVGVPPHLYWQSIWKPNITWFLVFRIALTQPLNSKKR